MGKQIASASIPGISHRNMFYNNQDAFKIIEAENFVVGIVCDGCGSCVNSEIGAKLTAEFTSNYCFEKFRYKKFNGVELANAVIRFYEECSKIILTKNKRVFFNDTFFVTIIGFIFSDKQNVIFSAGDGVIVVDNEIEIINQENAPDYLTHNLLSKKSYSFNERVLEKGNFSRVLIATDGIEDLWVETEPKDIIEKLFAEDNFKDDINLFRFLSQSEIYDDTTLVLFKQR